MYHILSKIHIFFKKMTNVNIFYIFLSWAHILTNLDKIYKKILFFATFIEYFQILSYFSQLLKILMKNW